MKKNLIILVIFAFITAYISHNMNIEMAQKYIEITKEVLKILSGL